MLEPLSEREWDTTGIDADGRLAPFTEREVQRVMLTLASEQPPRRFTLCHVAKDDDGEPWDVEVIGWGLALDEEEALFYLPGPTEDHKPRHGLVRSAEKIRAQLARRGDVRLFWHDPVAVSADAP